MKHAHALAGAGFSTVVEVETAERLWRGCGNTDDFGRYLRAPGFGSSGGEALLEAVQRLLSDELVSPDLRTTTALQIRDQILSGELAHGEELGTGREFARREGLSLNAAATALGWLSDAGWVGVQGQTVVVLNPGAPYEVRWSDAVPADVRRAASDAAELLRRNPGLDVRDVSSWPALRALRCLTGVEIDHLARTVRVVSAQDPAHARWRSWRGLSPVIEELGTTAGD